MKKLRVGLVTADPLHIIYNILQRIYVVTRSHRQACKHRQRGSPAGQCPAVPGSSRVAVQPRRHAGGGGPMKAAPGGVRRICAPVKAGIRKSGAYFAGSRPNALESPSPFFPLICLSRPLWCRPARSAGALGGRDSPVACLNRAMPACVWPNASSTSTGIS